MTDDLNKSIKKALEDISGAYVRDEDGNLLPTTILRNEETGEVIARWERGSKTPAEVDAIVRQANEIDALPSRGPGRPEIGPLVNVRMPADMLAWLDDVTEALDCSRAETVRRILQYHRAETVQDLVAHLAE